MFHLGAFASSSAGTYSSLTQIPPATDPVAAINGNFLFVPTLSNLIGAYALGTGMLRAQLSSPSILADVPFDVLPIDAAAVPSATAIISLQPNAPVPLITDEPLSCSITSGSGTGHVVVAFLSDGPIAPVSGKIIHARATIATGSTGYSWQNAALTLTNQLAEGNYALVGARVEGAHTIAARFVFAGSNNSVRPGVIAVNGKSGVHIEDYFRNGQMGIFGTFSNRVLPTVDYIGDGTGETATVILDLIKQ